MNGYGFVFCAPFRGIGERRGEKRRRGAQIVIAKRRDPIHDARAQPWECRIKLPEAGSDAALPAFAKNRLQKSILEARRIGHADSRSKIVILRWR